MKYIKLFESFGGLDNIVNDGQYFLSLEDDGFFIEIYDKDAGKKSGIQSNIMIYKPINGRKTQYNDGLIEFDYNEIRDELLRFIELSDKDIHYIYANTNIGSGELMLYDPNNKTRLKCKGDIFDDTYEVGPITRLTIVYGLN